MDMRRHIASQLRQLRQEQPRHPWLAARLASLLLASGRRKEALALLRKTAPLETGYTSGRTLLARLLEEDGDTAGAEALRGEICRELPGSHAAWLERLRAAREDEVLHHRLLLQAWSRDLFSLPLNQELVRAGLVGADDYEQALRPTAVEAARREEQFRRLLDLHAGKAPAAAPEEVPRPCEASGDVPDEQELGEDGDRTEEEAVSVPRPGGKEAGHEVDDEVSPGDRIQGEDENESEYENETKQGMGSEPPRREGREPLLREHAERLEGLSRPLSLGLPEGLSAEAARRVRERPRDLFDPRSMMTRRLARIYLEQGYPGLAIRVLEALALREPGAGDLSALLEAARAEEQRLAEQPAGRRRR